MFATPTVAVLRLVRIVRLPTPLIVEPSNFNEVVPGSFCTQGTTATSLRKRDHSQQCTRITVYSRL